MLTKTKNMTTISNTKAPIEILEKCNCDIAGRILIIKETVAAGSYANETKESNTIYDAAIVYEF